MSGSRPRAIPSPSPTQHSLAPAPFIAPQNGTIEQRLAQMAEAINQKADRNTPVFYWIKLVAPNGTTYAVSVDDIGNLHTTQVLRA